MLQRPEGATVDEGARATGWQRHTVRGVFSGTLKKKLGRYAVAELPTPRQQLVQRGTRPSPSGTSRASGGATC